MLGYFNGHVDRHIDEFDGSQEGIVWVRGNWKEKMLLEFCMEIIMCVRYTA